MLTSDELRTVDVVVATGTAVEEVVDDPKCRRSGSLSVVVSGEVRLCCLQPPRTGSNWHKPGVLLTAAVEFSREPRRRLRRTTTLLELLREKLLQPLHWKQILRKERHVVTLKISVGIRLDHL